MSGRLRVLRERLAGFWRAFVGRYAGRPMMLVVLLGCDAVGGASRLVAVSALDKPGAFPMYLGFYLARLATLALTLVAPRSVARLFIPILALITVELIPVAGALDDPTIARTYVAIVVGLSSVVALFASLRGLVTYLVVACAVIAALVVPTQPVLSSAVVEASYSMLGSCFPAAVLFGTRARLARATAAAQELARVDPLTGVLNRRGLQERLVEVVGRALRERSAIVFLVVDLDHFKRVNDELGHLVGDEVLTLAATGVREAIRPCDILARTGGEEFVVVADGPPDGVGPLAERVRRELARATAEYHVTASVGAAVALPPTGEGAMAPWLDGVVARADAALYEAKRAGRDRVVVAEHSPRLVPPRSRRAPAGTVAAEHSPRGTG